MACSRKGGGNDSGDDMGRVGGERERRVISALEVNALVCGEMLEVGRGMLPERGWK